MRLHPTLYFTGPLAGSLDDFAIGNEIKFQKMSRIGVDEKRTGRIL